MAVLEPELSGLLVSEGLGGEPEPEPPPDDEAIVSVGVPD